MSETTSTPLDLSKEQPSRQTRLLEILSVTLLFSLITAFHMGSALTDCTSTIMGGPGDATSGNIWFNWQYEALHSGPWPTHSPFTNAPIGEAVWHPYYVTAALVQFPMWILTFVTNPVCSWNLSVFMGFMASALFTYGFIRWITNNQFAALFAGYAYAFSPFHMYKAQGHIGYLYSYVLVALIWAFLALWRRPTWKGSILLGIALAGTFYTDGYYILIGSVTLIALVIAAVVHDVLRKGGNADMFKRLGSLFGAGIVAVVLLIPMALIFSRNQDSIVTATIRNKEELRIYSARLTEYVLPARSHPVFSKKFGAFQDQHLHASNYSEQTLFLGWSVLILALYGVALIIARRKDPHQLRAGLPPSLIVVTLGAVGLLTLFFSAPPNFDLLGLDLRGPSFLVFKVLPVLRVYARFFVAVHAAVVGMAGVGLSLFLARKPKVIQIAVTSVLLVILAFEMLTVPPRGEWSYNDSPPEYYWLKHQSGVRTIAEYPMAVPPHHVAFGYLTYQPVHGKRLVNSSIASGPQQPLRNGIFGLSDPQTPSVLRRLGATIVLVHTDYYPEVMTFAPPDFKLIARFGNTLVLGVPPGGKAKVALAIGSGFYAGEHRGFRSFRWMPQEGRLRVVSFESKVRRARVEFLAESFSVGKTIVIAQNGKEIWRGRVENTRVAFEAEAGPEILIRSLTPSVRGPGTDTRQLTIGISELTVEPAG